MFLYIGGKEALIPPRIQSHREVFCIYLIYLGLNIYLMNLLVDSTMIE